MAGQLGQAEVAFLRYPDGDLEDTRVLRREVVAWIRRWRPRILFTHDPEHPYPPYLCHRDHRITGRVALDAAYPLARDRLTFPEQGATGLAPHAVVIWRKKSNCVLANGMVDTPLNCQNQRFAAADSRIHLKREVSSTLLAITKKVKLALE